MKKKDPLENLPAYDIELRCDICDSPGAADFQTQTLCLKCVAKDVFEDYDK
jgi:hypothetical protein